MTLLIATPDTHTAERDYSLGVILGEFLGLLGGACARPMPPSACA